ncbi:hypothetical protein CDAR_205931 [Caerostris darwini]|uniref:Uncharacterized protein n=1 Tax=Caerostris darwini TaxID=1538125 RepID=A0AAV4WLE3_9ARAC|nr:hypothetical protein CDAR_205931 [Caerostris darwini]
MRAERLAYWCAEPQGSSPTVQDTEDSSYHVCIEETPKSLIKLIFSHSVKLFRLGQISTRNRDGRTCKTPFKQSQRSDLNILKHCSFLQGRFES